MLLPLYLARVFPEGLKATLSAFLKLKVSNIFPLLASIRVKLLLSNSNISCSVTAKLFTFLAGTLAMMFPL